MFILKIVFFVTALGGLPVAVRFGLVSLGGLAAGLICLFAAVSFLSKPVVPRAAALASSSLALFFSISLAWTIYSFDPSVELRSDFIVWGGMLFLTLLAARSTAETRNNIAIVDRVVRRSSYVYVAVLIWLVLSSTEDAATPQVGVVYFSYFLARVHQGHKRSIVMLLAIVVLQTILAARIVVGAELLLLVFSQALTHRKALPRIASVSSVSLSAVVVAGAAFTMMFASSFVANMFGGDAAVNIGKFDINTSGRMYWWRIAFESAVQAPLLGHGTPGPTEMLETTRWSHPHNDYIRIFHQTGLVGCFLWLTYVTQGFIAGLRGARNLTASILERRLCHATCMSLVGLSIVMITDNAIVYSYVVYPCSILVGVSLGLQKKTTKRHGENRLSHAYD